MIYFKNSRWLTLLIVSVSLILVCGFANYAAAGGKETNCTDGIDNDHDGKIDCNDSDCSTNAACIDRFITPDKLHSWLTNGYNDGVPDVNGYSQMIVIFAGQSTVYAAGHPTGSYLWNYDTEMRTTRSDGILPITQGVLTKPMMDTVIQKIGIDTTKVLVLVGDNFQHLGSAYYDLRYWGFPKKQLRVVNGLLKDYKIAYPADIVTTTPAPANGTYSVCNQSQATSIDEVRAPLDEVMTVAKDNTTSTMIWDVRELSEYNGQNPTIDTSFSGHIRTAKSGSYLDLLTNGSPGNAGAQIKDAAAIKTILSAKGITSSLQTTYVHCRTGIRAGVAFLAIDARLGWKVKKFEGSWILWGNLSDEEGILASNSPWKTNNTTYSASIDEAISTNRGAYVPGYGQITPIGCSYAVYAERTNANDKQMCSTNYNNCICTSPCDVPFTTCVQTYDCKDYTQ